MAEGKRDGLHDMATGVLLANRWQILSKIGCGGMGTVYACWDSNLGKRVAVKVLNEEWQDDPMLVARFHREIETLVGNSHPNIVVIHACSPKDKEPPVWLVMEFLDGPTLNSILEESPGRRLHPQRIRRIGTQMLDALETVHSHGIIHRDLKPENVFVLPGRRRTADMVKLVDFGIAKTNENQTPADVLQRLTQVGTVVGTPYYMSPEQCLGSAHVDGRTDLYAVGVMFFEMATGRLPFVFNNPNREDILAAHVGTCPDAPRMIAPDISPELEMVILKSLAKKPADRFADAAEFGEALEAAIPRDPEFYRDSQRASPIDGRAMTTPPRIPTAAEDEQPTAERPEPAPDLSKTPTRLLADKRPPAGIALAKTMTPADLKRAAEEETAHQFAKNFGVWIRKPSRRAAVISISSAVFVLIVLMLLVALLPNGKNTKAIDAGTTADAADTEVSAPLADQPDVIVPQVPLPIPAPVADVVQPAPEDAGTTAVEVNTGESEAQSEAAEIGTTSSPTPPAGYEELLRQGTSAFATRNYRLAARRFTAATELWREGAEAWRGLGDALLLLGRRPEAKTALREYLQLAPDAPDAAYYRGIVGNK